VLICRIPSGERLRFGLLDRKWRLNERTFERTLQSPCDNLPAGDSTAPIRLARHLGREPINLLDRQLARVRYAPIADALLRSSEATPYANNGNHIIRSPHRLDLKASQERQYPLPTPSADEPARREWIWRTANGIRS
jgi:hypothetical protein